MQLSTTKNRFYNFNQIITTLFLLILSTLILNSCMGIKSNSNLEETVKSQRDSILKEHSFNRDEFDPDNLELLAGNGEMGGLVRHDGLGFDSIWSSSRSDTGVFTYW